MDIRKYAVRKRPREVDGDSDIDSQDKHTSKPARDQQSMAYSASTSKQLTKAEKKKMYKSHLTYNPKWEDKYGWLYCNNPGDGMFCRVCQESGTPPQSAKGAWTTRGMKDWNHATEILKNHNTSQWHRDAITVSRMAEQAKKRNVLEMQISVAAKEAEEKRTRNRTVLLKLLRSTYFLVKNHIPHTTNLSKLVQLQVANGDELLKRHVEEGAANAQYTSSFSSTRIIEAIDTWINRKLEKSLKDSPFFSVMADESEDITSKEELSICCRWLVDGRPEEHFLTILHVTSTDAKAITAALTSFMEMKGLEYQKLIGQGYDGAATFSGVHNGVQKRMQVHACHALYLHCACHRLQLASMQAAEGVKEIKGLFGMMTNIWKLFYNSPKKAEKLVEIQAILHLPQLKIVKPSDTRWLSHERCIRAIKKELPALIVTLQQLYESSGDAEAFGIALLLASQVGIAGIALLSEVLDLLAKLNTYMQRKTADFTRLSGFVSSIIEELKLLKTDGAKWCSDATSLKEILEEKHGIPITARAGATRGTSTFSSIEDFRVKVAIPYLSALIENIERRFSGNVVKLLAASSVFAPSLFPPKENVNGYGDNEIELLSSFYGSTASVEYEGVTYTSPPLLDADDLRSEWKVYRRAMLQEKDMIMAEKDGSQSLPTMQELSVRMMSCHSYVGIFPEMFKLIQIILCLPVGTATVERSFSQMKMVKTRLRNRLSDENLPRLMRIAIEGPELESVNFEDILDIFKESNRRISL